MSNEQTAKSLPSHRIYAVSQTGKDKAKWQEIGSAWAHKDREGFNLQFDARPLEGAVIVLRAAKPRKAATEGTRVTGGRYDSLRQASGKRTAKQDG